jgi:predicted aldo/keto reductase-like oxidoreductase
MRRRSFFGSAAAAAGLAAAQNTGSKLRAGDVPRRKFGKTGEELTIVGQAGGRLGMVTADEARAIVRRAYDLGLNYFDIARIYWNGRSEEIMGEVLQPHRKELFITSKSATYTKEGALKDLHASLKALRTDYIDLWQIHQVGELKEVEQIFGPGGSIEAFEQAKKEGKCRFIGFTGHRDPNVHLEMLKRYDKYDTILMPLNPADPSYLSFEKLVLPVAIQRGLGIQAMKGTANAKLLHALPVRDCLRYALSLPGVTCLAVGCTTLGQIEDDVRIAKEFQSLNETELAAMRKRAARFGGPGTEDWKINTQKAAAYTYRDGALNA